MKRYNKHIELMLFLVFSLITSTAFAQLATQVEVKTPKLLTTAGEEQQVIKPNKEQQVAVVDLVINASEGTAKSIELRSVKLVNSFAPKVFARQTEERNEGWKITIIGQETASFTVTNPLNDIEIENPENANSPYSMVKPSGPVEWTLIVPLYKDGKPLGAKTIEIQDIANKNIKLSVALNNDAK